MLDSLDDVGWDALTHAYGNADDTAEALRRAASGDPDEAAGAVAELHGSIFHQGSVYPATVAAVPFLAELAWSAPHRRPDLVWTLGELADPRHAGGPARVQVRVAVAGQLRTLVALLEDRDPRVREAAAFAAVRAGVTAAPLWRRWAVEDDPAVRASLALALGETDPRAAGPVLAGEALRGVPEVRLAAALALSRAGQPWPAGAAAALVGAIDAGATITYSWGHATEWYTELVVNPPAPVAAEVVRTMLRSPEPATRRAGILSLSERCDGSRSAPAVFIPLVAPLLDDPEADVRHAAVKALRRAGAAAAPWSDRLAELAARAPGPRERRSTVREDAVGTLLLLGDPRWVGLVCAARAQDSVIGFPASGIRFTPAVLAAVRERLAADPARVDVLSGVVRQWGPAAAAAVPELLAALPQATPEAVLALLELGHDDHAMLPQLRRLVTERCDLRAALAIRRLTGDASPVLEALRTALVRGLLGRCPQLPPGPVLQPLLPEAREYLTGAAARFHPQRETQMLAARIAAAVTGPAEVLPTVRAVLVEGDTPARSAADVLADLALRYPGDVSPLGQDLWDRLGDPGNRLAAARALARLGVPAAELAGALVAGITDHPGRGGLDLILELGAVETVPGLRALAAADERLEPAGPVADLVWSDELLREQIAATIEKLGYSASAQA